ncbi:MAG TPA: hypothetical protein VF974_00765 [Patescibacteria group bacterium]
MKQLENKIIGYMRNAITNLDKDDSIVHDNMYNAHDLFTRHLMEWSNDFCILYNCMLEIYRAYNPMPIGHFTTKHIEVGYSSFPIVTWIPDKEQPAGPTSVELLKRFTDLFADVTEGVTHAHTS